MQYVGIQSQKSRNNWRSVLLLFLFPLLVMVLLFVFLYLFYVIAAGEQYAAYSPAQAIWPAFIEAAPWALGVVAVWFLIAYLFNTSIIGNATGSRPLERTQNKRVYNLVENLCMSQGMPMPKINVIDDSSLNAFASGINKKSYTVTLTTGIIEKLDDDELEGVIAHELTHIRNSDVRLLIVSIVFVGIFAMIAQISLRMLPRMSGGKKGGGVVVVLLLAVLLAGVGYFFSTMMRFAISRKREYMADAGAAEMTRNPTALASALRKISDDPQVEAIKRDDVAQLFIEHPMGAKGKKKGGFSALFATHPPIEQRIAVLEKF